MKNINPSIQELSDYSVPQTGCPVKLNQNESPFDVPPDLKEEIIRELARTPWNRYPSAQPVALTAAIAEYTGHPSPGIVIGNGSNEMIQTLFLACCRPADQLLVASPGFAIYPRLAAILGMKVSAVPLLENFAFHTQAIIESGRKSRLIFLASPNNPTGTLLAREEIEAIAQNTNGLLVVDEAYYEFYKKSVVDLVERYANLVILRTFSKAFSLAGARIGYLLTNEKLAAALNKTKLPYSLGIFQQVAGTVLLKNVRRSEPFLQKIIDERERVLSELQNIPNIKAIPSAANFILFKTIGKPAAEVYETLKQRGILLRYFATTDIADWMRVSIGLPEENTMFLKNLREIMAA
jgi:histidinol-phosphate aminotransferase